jgi:hypothetical protein
MKGLLFVLCGLVAVSGSAWAQPQRVPISVTGAVETDAGLTKITDQSLVSAPGNRLVLMIDLTTHVVAIEEWDAPLLAQVDRDPVLRGTQALLENFRMAVVGGRALAANLEMVDMDWDDDGADDHDGNLQLLAKITLDPATGALTKFSASLEGVLNDPVNSLNGAPNQVLRAKLKTTGPVF